MEVLTLEVFSEKTLEAPTLEVKRATRISHTTCLTNTTRTTPTDVSFVQIFSITSFNEKASNAAKKPLMSGHGLGLQCHSTV